MEKVNQELTTDCRICELCGHKAECHVYVKGSFLQYFKDPEQNWKDRPVVHNTCYNCSLDLVQFDNFRPLELGFEFNREELLKAQPS